jgi:hypothetical protein
MSFGHYRRNWMKLFGKSSRRQRRAGEGPTARLAMIALEDRVTPASVTINGGDNSSWFINDSTTTSNGLPSGGTTAGGSGATINDATLNTTGQGDAFDSGAMVWINDMQVGGALTQTGNTVDFAPSSIAGLNVAMHYYIASNSATARVFVSLSNPTGSPIMVPVDYATNFGSDGGTTIQASSDGNTSFDVTDRWLVTDDSTSGGDPANTTVLFGPGTPAVTPSSVSTTVFDSAGTEGALARYFITIGAGQTRSLIWFQQLNPTSAEAITDAATFFDVNPTFGGDLLSGLSVAQVNSVANFSLNADTLSADLVGTTLTIADLANNDNSFNVSVSGTDLVITDTVGTFPGGSSTYTIPLASVTSLVINGFGGNDSLTVDYTGGALPATIEFNGGTGGTDSLAVLGGSTTTQSFNFTNENDGSVVLAGAIAGTINYTGLEPVSSTINATNVVLNYSGATETITVTDAGGGQTMVDSTAGESVTFDNPTDLLEINAGAGTDTINVTSFGAGFGATLDIDGEGDAGDTVNLNAAVSYAADKNLTVSAEIISVTAAQTLAGTGSVNLTAGRNVFVGAALSANNVSLSGDNGTSQVGTFHGVEIAANVTATGTITAQGRGSQGVGRFGVLIWNDAVVQGGTGPGTTVSITGTGGDGFINYGVAIGQFTTTGTITSSGGNVQVTGFGGGTINNDNDGVQVVTAGSRITAGGTGSVTVQGTGSTLGNSTGVNVEPGAIIDSAGGNVSVTGVGGSTAVDVGVGVRSAGLISAGGAGTVTVTGTGIGDATPAFVRGVVLRTVLPISSGIIRSNGGAVSITGVTTDGGIGVTQDDAGTAIGAVGVNVPVTITTDSFNSVVGSAVVSGTGTTTFRPSTSGTTINLGGADVLTGSPRTLGLTDAELDRVTAGTINIGNSATGDLSVTSPISVNTNVLLATGNGKTATVGAKIDAGAGSVSFAGLSTSLSVVSDLTWTKSTVVDAGGAGGPWVPPRTTPPAAGTFTQTPTFGNAGGIDGTDVADIGGGAVAISSVSGVYYFRTTFTLPSATGITANIRLSVDNNAQVFINGQEVARETTFTGANFNGPNYPAFRINPDGSISNIVQFDTTFPFTGWIAGTNELVVSVRNTDGGDSGGLVFRMDITADSTTTIIPSAAGVDIAGSTATLGTGNTLGIAINGTTVDTQYQQLNVTGGVDITGSKLLVSGSHVVAPGDSFVIVNNDGGDPVVGTFAGLIEGSKVTYAGGSLYITYKGGDGNDVVLNANPTINGTAAGDKLVVTPTATGYDYQLNADPVVSVVGALPLTFNGLDGDDTLVAILNAFTLPSIAYNGGNQDAPASAGTNTVFGDVLVVNDTTKTHTATYLGDGVAGAADNDGTIAILGQGTITFTQLEPVDMIGLAVVNVTFANADDVITIAEGKDSATNTLDAIVVSGTSGGVGFEQVHLRNNTQVNIDTTTVDGDDTVTITGAANGHGNANINIDTGTGTDLVTITGASSFSGAVAINTVDYTSAAAGSLLAGTDIDIDITGNLLANGSIQVQTGNIDIDADGSATFNAIVLTINSGSGSVSVDTGTTLTVGAAGQLAGFTSVTTNTGGDTTFNGQVISAGPISITSGGTLSTSAQIFSDFGLGGTITTSSVGDTTFGGNVQVMGAGSISISTSAGGNLTINSPVSTNGGDVTATVAGSSFVNAAVSASGSVSIASAQDFTSVAAGTISAGTTVVIDADVAADADVVGATVSIGGVITAVTTTTITTGGDADSVTISAAINGTSASVSTAGAADSIVVNTSGTAPLTLDGGASGDSYTVNVGTLNAAVSVADTGATGTDTLNVNGTAAANTFEVNSAAGGDSKVVVDGTQTVNYTKTLEVLNLDGADAGDTFNIFFTQGGATSFLPASVNIVDTGATAGDVANISGTDLADVIDVNYSATRTTSGLGSTITYLNGNLETLNVDSKDGSDLVYAKAVSLVGGGPVVNLDGNTPSAPTTLPGDILILDVLGMTGLSTANIKTPDGSVPSTSHNLLTWVDFETIPTPIGLGGSFEFGTTTSPVQAGPYVVPPPASYWVGVNGANTFPTKGYYGWNTPVNSYDRGNNSPNPMQTTFQKLLRDGNWFGPANVSRTFSVAAIATGDYQVSITIGDTAVVMDNVFVTIEGSAQQLVPTVFQNQFITITGIGSDMNGDQKIDISFVDKGGTHSYWHVNALDVRPVDLVSPVTIMRADGMATALTADGLTKTTYFADGFFPNAIVTVATTNGKIASVDIDPFLVGVQVLADGTGKATFELQHPTGNGDVTLTASAAVVVDAIGTFTQAFNLTPSQKIDFNGPTTPTETGYLGFTNTLYAGPATNGLGWLQAVQLGDRGATAGSALFRDFAFNFSGPTNRGEFNIDLPTGTPHVVTVYLGDLATARDRLQVEAFDGTSYAVLATEIATSKVNSQTFTVTPVDIGGGNFQVRLRFSDLGGTQNGWSIMGLEYRTLASQQLLAVAPTVAVAGNGVTVTNYTITGGAAGGLVTVSNKFGAIQGTDASTLYDGFQVLLDGSGAGGFAIKSPVVASGSLASVIGLVAVNGSHVGGLTQQYSGAKVSYDFGTATSPVAGGFTFLSGTQLATAQNGVGFAAVAGAFDRNPASFPLIPADQNLYRDGVTGTGTGGFRVLAEIGATNVNVRVYAYDANSTRGNLTVTGEGGAKQTLPTSLTVPAVFDVVASDTNMDGFLDISIAGFSTWVMNGIEVG